MDPHAKTASTQPGSAEPAREVEAERYVLLDRLGDGGMGVVWKAHDRVLDRSVAMKLLHDRFLSADDQARLAAEARAMAKLTHPNIVAVYDVGEREGRTYVTMELVTGQNLARWLETPRGWREVVAAFRAAGDGLAAAHAAGVIHRDIKPSNLLIGEDGRVRVADFGVASEAVPGDLDAVVARTASIAGTPAYMAPERLDGRPADTRSDQFSFGVALWEALHGRRPFEAESVPALREVMARLPKATNRDVPARIQRAVERAISPDPAARFPSVAALVAALAPRRRWPWAAGAVVVVAAGAVAFALARPAASSPSCQGAEHQLDGVWDDAARARLEQAFSAAGEPYASSAWHTAEAQLDDYRSRWTEGWLDACRAHRVEKSQDARLFALRSSCLSSARRVLGDAVAQLSHGEAEVLELAPDIVRALPDLAGCADLEKLTAIAGERYTPSAAGTVDGHLSTAQEQLAAGDRAAARAEVDRALEGAAGRDDLVAHVLVVRAMVDLADGRPDDGLAALDEATRLATSSGATFVLVDADLVRGSILVATARYDDASEALDRAYAALYRQNDFPRDAKVSRGRVDLYRATGRHQEALQELFRARKLEDAAFGGHHWEIDIEIAEEEAATGSAADAVVHARDYLGRVVAQYGADHPFTRRQRARVEAIEAATGRAPSPAP